MARQAGRFEEIIPAWVFAVRGTVPRLLVAVRGHRGRRRPVLDRRRTARSAPRPAPGARVGGRGRAGRLVAHGHRRCRGRADLLDPGRAPGRVLRRRQVQRPPCDGGDHGDGGRAGRPHPHDAAGDGRRPRARRAPAAGQPGRGGAARRRRARRRPDHGRPRPLHRAGHHPRPPRGGRAGAGRAPPAGGADQRVDRDRRGGAPPDARGARRRPALGEGPRARRAEQHRLAPGGARRRGLLRRRSGHLRRCPPRRRRAAPLPHRVLGRRSLPLRGDGRGPLGPLPRGAAAVGAPPLLLVRGGDPRHRAPAGRVRGAAGCPPRRAREDPGRARPHRPHPVHHAPAPEPPHRPRASPRRRG